MTNAQFNREISLTIAMLLQSILVEGIKSKHGSTDSKKKRISELDMSGHIESLQQAHEQLMEKNNG